jgi:hypothetical protein
MVHRRRFLGLACHPITAATAMLTNAIMSAQKEDEAGLYHAAASGMDHIQPD